MQYEHSLQRLLTVGEAATLLRIRPHTLYVWAARRVIPVQKVGRALRFDPRALRKWLRGQERKAATQDSSTHQRPRALPVRPARSAGADGPVALTDLLI